MARTRFGVGAQYQYCPDCIREHSVFGLGRLSLSIFQHWRVKQEKADDATKHATEAGSSNDIKTGTETTTAEEIHMGAGDGYNGHEFDISNCSSFSSNVINKPSKPSADKDEVVVPSSFLNAPSDANFNTGASS
jgi:hypothetical protein